MRSSSVLLLKTIVAMLAMRALLPPARAEKLVLAAGGSNETKINAPFGIACDSAGNLFIAEGKGNRVFKMDTHGKLTAIAGNGTKGDSGDDGPALEGQFNFMH